LLKQHTTQRDTDPLTDAGNAAATALEQGEAATSQLQQRLQVIVVACLSGVLFFVVAVHLFGTRPNLREAAWQPVFTWLVVGAAWVNVVTLYLQATQRLQHIRLIAFPLAVLYALLIGYLIALDPSDPAAQKGGEYHLFFFLPILCAALFYEVPGALAVAFVVCAVSAIVETGQRAHAGLVEGLPTGLLLRCVLWLLVATVTGFFVREERRLRDRTAAALTHAHRRMQELSALIDVGQQLTSTLNMRQLLRLVMDLAAGVMQAEAGAVFLVDDETGELIFEAAMGEKADEIEQRRLPRGQGIAGWVVEHGEPLLVPHTAEDSRWYPGVDAESGFRTRSILCVPLQSKGRTMGALEVLNKQAGEQFDADDLRLCSAMASQVVVALENARLVQRMETAFLSTVESLASALEFRDTETEGHSRRVRDLAVVIGRKVNLTDEDLLHLGHGALLHDIGKIAVPDAILRKPGELTEEEYGQMRRHCTLGWQIVSRVEFLRRAGEIVHAHHEWFDGTGYPRGLAGEEIPLGARVFAVADAFDAMTSNRLYRKARSFTEARDEIRRCAGTQFDPVVVEAFMTLADSLLRSIQASTRIRSHDLTQATAELLAKTGTERPPVA
jgi:putative nucleotidyltransferase with HDIG domain